MQLIEYLSSKGLSQSDLARKLSVSTTHFNLVVHKKRLPSIYLARKIEAFTQGEVSVADLFDIKPHKSKYKLSKAEEAFSAEIVEAIVHERNNGNNPEKIKAILVEKLTWFLKSYGKNKVDKIRG